MELTAANVITCLSNITERESLYRREYLEKRIQKRKEIGSEIGDVEIGQLIFQETIRDIRILIDTAMREHLELGCKAPNKIRSALIDMSSELREISKKVTGDYLSL
ncbi:MAG: hypothetical protein HQK96_19685 [Nitrospirae bacterium]|nr:hypothetical protein [Nitrospirota bacterium]